MGDLTALQRPFEEAPLRALVQQLMTNSFHEHLEGMTNTKMDNALADSFWERTFFRVTHYLVSGASGSYIFIPKSMRMGPAIVLYRNPNPNAIAISVERIFWG